MYLHGFSTFTYWAYSWVGCPAPPQAKHNQGKRVVGGGHNATPPPSWWIFDGFLNKKSNPLGGTTSLSLVKDESPQWFCFTSSLGHFHPSCFLLPDGTARATLPNHTQWNNSIIQRAIYGITHKKHAANFMSLVSASCIKTSFAGCAAWCLKYTCQSDFSSFTSTLSCC